MKFKFFVSIILSIILVFTFCGQTAFASTFPATQSFVRKYMVQQLKSAKAVVPAPIASVSAGTYKSSLVVKLSGTGKKSTIYYTLDGTTPTTGSKAYSKPITLTASCNLKAFAADSSGNTSEVISNIYTILTPPSKPVASVLGGTYTAVQNVTLTDLTPGVLIYYTLDGAKPTIKSNLYKAPVAISKSLTLKAIAIDKNGMSSEVVKVSYTISSPVTAAPSPSSAPLPTPSATPAPSPSPSAAPSATHEPTPAPSPSAAPVTPISPSELSVWVAYWDWQSGMNDVNAMAQMPGSIQLFGASFNSDDKLFLPNEMQTLTAAAKAAQSAHPGMQVYLTIVNDWQDAAGKWTEKDSGLLDRLMQSDDSRTSHINDILSVVSQGNYSGVEIDYEKINDGTWSGFAAFCSQLYSALQAKGLGMRVCLEEYAPFAKGGLPTGPEYTVMAYNLCWQGSAPGPKADFAFIKQVAQKMAALPGNKRMAFAAGGYDWAANGGCVEVTEAQAAALSQKSTDVQRDSQSGGLHFTYQVNGITHTVWYADAQTLKGWFDQARSMGITNTALWKMGGNRTATLQMLGGLS